MQLKKAERELASIDEASLNNYLNKIPVESWKKGLRNYFEILGLDQYDTSYEHSSDYGAANNGISNYNHKLLERNSCFKELSGIFYETINHHDAQKAIEGLANKRVSIPLSLSTQNTDYEDGWLWKTAMQISNNQPNLAMTLIGLCGHDNTLQISGSETDLGTSIITGFSSDFNRKNYIRNTEAYFNKIYKSNSESNRHLQKEALEDILQANMVVCPQGLSGMYLPGSLGKDTQISNRLIQNIAKVQAPERGAEALPSKYYHTIGAAYMACNLVSDAVPAPLIRSLTSMAIHNYRTKRLCEFNGDEDVRHDDVIRRWGIKKTADELFKYSKDQTKCSPSNNAILLMANSNSSGNKTQEPNHESCETLYNLKEILFKEGMSKEDLEKNISAYLDKINADILLRKYVTMDRVCSSPLLFKGETEARLDHASRSFVRNCGDLNAQECERAKQVLRTYMIDFKWSEAQHLAGAEFAIKNCTPSPNFHKENLEKTSCSALEKIKNQSPESNNSTSRSSEAVY